jgi:hypothetical protein
MPDQKRIFKSKPQAIIMDLDGVLVDSSERFKRLDLDAFENRDKLTYMKSVKDYSKDCVGDIVIPEGFNLLKSLVEFSPNIFFVTARGETGRNPTLDWMNDNICDPMILDKSNKVFNWSLIMHPENLDNYDFSTQHDHAEYKKKEAKKLMEQYEIIYAVDDSWLNCEAFISLDITTLHFVKPNLGRVLV